MVFIQFHLTNSKTLIIFKFLVLVSSIIKAEVFAVGDDTITTSLPTDSTASTTLPSSSTNVQGSTTTTAGTSIPVTTTTTTTQPITSTTTQPITSNTSNSIPWNLTMIQDSTGKVIIFPLLDGSGRTIFSNATEFISNFTKNGTIVSSSLGGVKAPGKDDKTKKGAKSGTTHLSSLTPTCLAILNVATLFVVFA